MSCATRSTSEPSASYPSGVSLSSPSIVVVAVLIGVLAIVGGAVLVPRIGARGRRGLESRQRQLAAMAQRVLVMTLCSALVSFAAGLVLNYRNNWYSSWSDVLGVGNEAALAVNPVQRGSVGQVADASTQPVETGRQYPPPPAPGQRLQRFFVPGGEAGVGNSVYVLLPGDYFDPAAAHRLYPVIMAGHGMPGHAWQWLHSMDIRRVLDPLSERGAFASSIVVLPEMETPGNHDTECVFSDHDPTGMEHWLVDTVPRFVEAHVRANPARDAWATLGFSAGGWCAAMLTMLHPQRFAAAMVLGGYFRPWWAGRPPADVEARRLDLVHLAGHHPPRVTLWVQSARTDRESGAATQEFLDAVRPPLAVTSVMLPVGGHNVSTWLPQVSRALTWLASMDAAFRGRASS